MILTATPTGAGLAPQRFQASGTDLTIGRGNDCDWTLADPTRQLSKRHCRMVLSDGSWRVTDLSSNGMTLNDRTVTPDAWHPVRDGDRLGMGCYDITLSIETARDRDADRHAAPQADAFPFGDGRQGGRLIGDPFVSPGAEDIADPFDIALPPFFEDGDQRPAASAGGGTGGSTGDAVSSLRQPFEPPRPGHLLLPADWDEPLAGQGSAIDPPVQRGGPDTLDLPHPPPFATGPAQAPASSPFEPPPFEPPTPTDPAPIVATPAARVPTAAMPVVATPTSTVPAESMLDTADINRPQAAPLAPPPAPPPGPPPQADDAALRAFAAFARGAGLDGMPQEAPEQALEKLGRAFRAYVVGLRRLLIARAAVKGEFRIDRTMIRPFGNNPIKFATDDNDALAALLGIGRQVGMTAEQAVADSIRDVRTHEVALTEAFHHGIRQVIAEMSPDQVTVDLPPGAFDALPVLRDSRRWAAYVARHARLQASLDNSLDSVFGQAFARGYEAALSGMADADAPATAADGRAGHGGRST